MPDSIMKVSKRKEDDMGIDSNKPVFTLAVTSLLSELPTHSTRQYIDMGLLIPYKLELIKLNGSYINSSSFIAYKNESQRRINDFFICTFKLLNWYFIAFPFLAYC